MKPFSAALQVGTKRVMSAIIAQIGGGKNIEFDVYTNFEPLPTDGGMELI